MLHKTAGIVLSTIKYRDTSLICRIYTEKLGLQTYIVNGVRSKKAKNKIALFQPLTILDLVVYKKENSDIQRISEMKILYPYQSIPFHFIKSTIALFLTELLSKVLREEQENEALYGFLSRSFMVFDLKEDDFTNFHLQFMLKLTPFLGFALHRSEELMSEVASYKSLPVDAHLEEKVNQLIASPYETPVVLSNAERRILLDLILSFYRLHIEGLKELKSLKVLQEMM